ncbi:MAG: hypothetical protein A2Y00_01165 [Omnitrophica WOR_2 bacterium GWF2_43_52]|nr:MAG: hypothetical protein A2062_03365 [Omnitrophica WOR_2 bacterium GWA2_44_7]OGX22019.1 MAG: hypothetical protein A2Y00_01165 [Omnitrophica WOR_2 bacterium GWF2_43_52]OGX52880.1 MAG: hypothetical protein A2460_03650 [Omnitrophica WOR_2 bacterium RIFOXYC2_FULL_43_9]HAH20935.1 hypothetical protein [Candidatus Omnitrophota bacterium]HBG63155.1 hypothetical protein [Candidatus Omnitrophota bacterium]
MKEKRAGLKIIGGVAAGVLFYLYFLSAYNGYRFHREKETRFMMDTYVAITGIGPKYLNSKAISLAFGRIREIDEKFNFLNSKSPLYAFNNEGKPITDPEVVDLIKKALDVYRESEGAFDITVAPIVSLWGFYDKEFRLPSDGQIQAALRYVGSQHLKVNAGVVEKDDPRVKIDLGGIAKGYAVQEALKILNAQGLKSALIDAGGDVYALGMKGRKLWHIGIKDPRADGLLGYVKVKDVAVMGSGDYERFFMKDDKRYHHIIDPRTGYPTQGIAGVTLIYSDPVLAQAWTKVVFVHGVKKGLALLRRLPEMEAIVAKDSGEIECSAGCSRVLNKL